MKKSLQERLNASLNKALDPPRKRPKQSLDALLEEYDDGQAVGEYRASILDNSKGIPSGIPHTLPEGIPLSIPEERLEEDQEKTAPITRKQRRTQTVKSPEESEEPSAEIFISVDATHTASEKIIYSHMYRETVSKGRQEGHFGPALLMKLSGIRSRNTVHKALYGLIEKLSVEKVTEAMGNPFGPRYRIYGPQEILRKRKAAGMAIDPQTKRILERDGIPVGIPSTLPEGMPSAITRNWDTPLPNFGIPSIPKFGILLNTVNTSEVDITAGGSSSNRSAGHDDEAFAGFVELMGQTAEEVTGRLPAPTEKNRWTELAELLSAELKIAAGRTTISSAPAFLTEHLRRRLWKKDRQQIETETGNQNSTVSPKVDITRCSDCFGTGMYYPEGYEKGVVRCRHERLRSDTEEVKDMRAGE
jgi:hypothetical protein